MIQDNDSFHTTISVLSMQLLKVELLKKPSFRIMYQIFSFKIWL